MVYGQRVRYLPSSTRELSERQKFDPVLRDGIFCGYRMHSGGIWSGQYLVIDAERFQEQQSSNMHTAYEHGVCEVYIPGSAADDKEEEMQFPCRTGLWKEKDPIVDPSVDDLDGTLQTQDDDVLPSLEREAVPDGEDGLPQNAGGPGTDPDGAVIDADSAPVP